MKLNWLLLFILLGLLVVPLTVSGADITVTGISPDIGVKFISLHVTVTGTGFQSGVISGGIYNESEDSPENFHNFTIVSDTEITGDLDWEFSPPDGEYKVFLNAEETYFTPENIFTVTSESEPTPTPTETPSVTPTSGNYTNTFSNTDIVRINQSSAQDPTGGKAEPWILWVLSGCTGLFLVALALMKPRSYRMDYEINIIISVLAWPFLWYWTWGGLTSVDYVVGTAMAGVNGVSVMITQHILYSYPILGYIGIGGCVAAVFVTILLIGQFKLFKENEEEQKRRGEQQ